ncbi:MAG TPA: helix-turn-helix domain-containing protein [Solirubrobacteraceae bacterium]|nr:helix-turn-helix domain-containing protein [Solirubrobacteraceae bacterium]
MTETLSAADAGWLHMDPPTNPSPGTGDRDHDRLLALLREDDPGALTVPALRDIGIVAPAQAVYELQLAGHAIDRIRVRNSDGRVSCSDRLHTAAARLPPSHSAGELGR